MQDDFRVSTRNHETLKRDAHMAPQGDCLFILPFRCSDRSHRAIRDLVDRGGSRSSRALIEGAEDCRGGRVSFVWGRIGDSDLLELVRLAVFVTSALGAVSM